MSLDFVGTKEELRELAEHQRKLCTRYYNKRHNFGLAKHNLYILLVPLQEKPEYRKASLEKQLLMLLNDTQENHKPEVYKYFKKFTQLEQDYKGLKMLIEAYASRISSLQSLMRWQREND